MLQRFSSFVPFCSSIQLRQVGSQAPFVSKPTLRARSMRFSKENSDSRLRRHDRAVHTLLPRRFDELRHDPQILGKRGRREPVCHQRVPRNPPRPRTGEVRRSPLRPDPPNPPSARNQLHKLSGTYDRQHLWQTRSFCAWAVAAGMPLRQIHTRHAAMMVHTSLVYRSTFISSPPPITC